MALYDFAKGIILEAGNKVRHWMKEDLDIETKSNPNDLVTNVIKLLKISFMKQYTIIIRPPCDRGRRAWT